MINTNTLLLQNLQQIVGHKFVFYDTDTLLQYGHDETEDYSFPPNFLVKPRTTQEIVAIVKLANEYAIPLVPIGGQTGLSGGALAIHGGIGLSMERLKILVVWEVVLLEEILPKIREEQERLNMVSQKIMYLI